MIRILTSIFLYLLLFAGKGVYAQKKYEELQNLVERNYVIATPYMSENGKWSVFRKSYEKSSDTIIVLNNSKAEEPVAVRDKVQSFFFVDHNSLLIRLKGRVELLNLKKQKSTFYEKIVTSQSVKNKSQFLLHNEKNELQLYNQEGELLSFTENTNKFYVTESGTVYAVANIGQKFEIIRFNDKEKRKVYETKQEIEYIEIDSDEKGIMIYERNNQTSFQEISYLDLTDESNMYSLKDILPINFKNGFREIITNGKTYFMKLWVDYPKEKDSIVDIWYGSDYQLEEKFMPATKGLYYIWEPKKAKIKKLGKQSSERIINIGSERYFLSFDPYLLNDYKTFRTTQKIYLFDIQKKQYTEIDTISSNLYKSADGNNILYSDKEVWYLYHIPTNSKRKIENKDLRNPYFSIDGESILFDGENGLWTYDLKAGKLIESDNFKNYKTEVLNGITKIIGNSNLYEKTIDIRDSVILKVYDKEIEESSCVLFDGKKIKTIIPFTSNRIRYLNYNKLKNNFSYTEENYNLPPRFVCKELKKEKKVLYQSNKSDQKILSLNQEIISYRNSEEVPLKGVLYYPLNYNSSEKYPMIVHIYEIQHKEANRYPLAYYGQPDSDGFNLRLLLERGYFVYLPDIVYGKEGTGLSALDCVNNALDALENHSLIDIEKIGLIGHSHGGYQTNFIATHSDRFSTYVSGLGNSDIVRSYFSFNYNFLKPFYFQYENGQYRMNKSFSEDKGLYFRNNPIHYVENVSAPILLWTGMKDQNIDWNQTMEFYVGLKRNNKEVIALFYPDEGHGILNRAASEDLVFRIINWFDYFLKDKKNIDWIDKEIKKEAF